MYIWIWNWRGGGYNWCKADTREEALQKAKELASGTVLVVDETTLRKGAMADVNALDRQYIGMFN